MSEANDKKRDSQTMVDETRQFWRETARDTVKGSAGFIDETAKQIIGVVGIMEGLYFHAITYANIQGPTLGFWQFFTYLLPLICWLFSLISASLVFFPRRYRININSSEAAKKLHEDTIERKYAFLMLALGLMIIGALFLVFALAVYLAG
jgi:hypothetical protein